MMSVVTLRRRQALAGVSSALGLQAVPAWACHVKGHYCAAQVVTTVTGPAGFGGAGPARPVAGDHASLAVDLHAPTPPGAYVVHWRVLAADTHVTQGDFTFKVEP